MVHTLRAELGTSQETVQRVADQLGYGGESVRTWVRQTDIHDGVKTGVTTDEQTRMRELEQEVRKLWKAARRAGITICRDQLARLMKVLDRGRQR